MRAVVAVALAAVTSASASASTPSLRGSQSAASIDNSSALVANLTANSTAISSMFVMDEAHSSIDIAQDIEANDESLLLQNGTAGSAMEFAAWGGWYTGGDKLWGHGQGVENINEGNAQYYNRGMDEARARCGGPGCALIVNPPGHRTVETFHIHIVHYEAWGANLKRHMESMTCRSDGWHSGGLPCHGKAKFFYGFPNVFSDALNAGGLGHASVVAWPSACGGRGTIVQLAYGCSIEHQIRGDFDPSKR